jgi:hypothetical protein
MSRIKTAWAALGLCFAAPLYAGASFELALAEPCEGTADPAKKVLAPVVSELEAASGDIECYISGSPVVLHATDVRATPDQYGAGSVEERSRPRPWHWSYIRSPEKKLILLKGHKRSSTSIFLKLSESKAYCPRQFPKRKLLRGFYAVKMSANYSFKRTAATGCGTIKPRSAAAA